MKIQNPNRNNQSGFVALLSTIVIGAVLLVMTIEAGKSGFYTSFLVLGNEAKEQSRLLALECGNRSLATLVSATVSIENSAIVNEIGFCKVHEIKKEYPSKEYVTMIVQGAVRDSVTNLELVYETGNIHLGDNALSYEIAREEPSVPLLYSVKEISVMP